MWFVAVACTERLAPIDGGGGEAKVEDGESLELRWEAVSTTAHPPCEAGVAVYDVARGEVLYVGNGSVPQMPWAACNSTWAYDGTDWVEVADAAHSPPWRVDSGLGYDPVRERVVLFGGREIVGSSSAITNEVWEWDGSTWSDATPPSNAVQPAPTTEPGVAWDPASSRLLVFGGLLPNDASYDTWAWDGAAWAKIDSDGPWALPYAAWDGEALVGVGNGTPGFGGWRVQAWDGAAWSEGSTTPFLGAPRAWYDPSPGVALFSGDPAKIYWRGPTGFELRATTGDPFPSSYWADPIFVYDPVRDRTVVWRSTWGDTTMELDAVAIADVPPAFVDPPDELRYDVGYETSSVLQAVAPDGDPPTLRLEDLPDTPWPVLKAYPPTAWALRWEPEADQIGEHVVTLVLSDGVTEVRHPVRLVVGERELPGFPRGQFTASGSGTARIGEAGASLTWAVEVECGLTVDNPGSAEIGCGAQLPFWVELSVDGTMHSPSEVLIDRNQLASGTSPLLFEEWGVSSSPLPLSDPWTWAVGSITETADGYDVVVAPSLPSGLSTELGELDEALVTHASAHMHLYKPAVADVSGLQPGDLVITEIMRNPKAVADAVGEWFEVLNASGAAVDLDGLEIWDADLDHTVVSGSLVVPDGEVVVFAVDGDPAVNGGVAPDAVIGGTVLANGADELYVGVGGTPLDAVEWAASGWPAPNGASMTLAPGADAASNDDPASWSAATASYGAGDRGTPGQR